MTQVICKGCGSAFIAGEPRWTGNEPEEHWHWNCYDRANRASHLAQVNAAMDKFNGPVERVRRALRMFG